MEKNASLRRGWTTGACATAATKAALTALLTGSFPDPVQITLPKGHQPSFALAMEQLDGQTATAGIIKDAGDDPDVTHGAMIKAQVTKGPAGSGIQFIAGKGVGTVTRPGLPIDVGEAAINPVPRQLIGDVVEALCVEHGVPSDIIVTISVPTGENLAQKTWNPRLGIVGGISILGTTGVVVPFSCSAWIHSIHRGVDVARAEGQRHVAGCTGSTSEKCVQQLYDLPDFAMLDMGDFAGGMLKYLRKHPIDRVTIGGGFAKLCKLAQGHMDLHSGRSQVDFAFMADQVALCGGGDVLVASCIEANSGLDILRQCQKQGIPIAAHIARLASQQALGMLDNDQIRLDVVVVGRDGALLAQTDPRTIQNLDKGAL